MGAVVLRRRARGWRPPPAERRGATGVRPAAHGRQLRRHRWVHGESRQRVQVPERAAGLARDCRHLAVPRLHGRCRRRGGRRAPPDEELPARAHAGGCRGRDGCGRHRAGGGVGPRGRPRGRRIRSRLAVGRNGRVVGGGHRRAADGGALPRPPGAPHRARRPGAGGARRGGRGGGTARIHPRCARARLGDVGRREPRRRHPQGDADPEGGGRRAGRPRCRGERHRAGRRPDVGRDPLRRSRSRRSPRLDRGDRPGRHRRPPVPQGLARPHVPGCGSVHLGGALGPARAPRLPAPAGGQGGRARERGGHRRQRRARGHRPARPARPGRHPALRALARRHQRRHARRPVVEPRPPAPARG